jgi:hypothetical protein
MARTLHGDSSLGPGRDGALPLQRLRAVEAITLGLSLRRPRASPVVAVPSVRPWRRCGEAADRLARQHRCHERQTLPGVAPSPSMQLRSASLWSSGSDSVSTASVALAQLEEGRDARQPVGAPSLSATRYSRARRQIGARQAAFLGPLSKFFRGVTAGCSPASVQGPDELPRRAAEVRST